MPFAARTMRRRARHLGAALALLAACDRPAATESDATLDATANADRAADDRATARDGRRGALPGRYLLPGAAVFPEGIAVDPITQRVFVTSTTDGTVFRGDVRDSTLAPFLAGGADQRTTAVGVAVDPLRQRLFVAGGATGRVFVYDARSGALLARLDGGSTPTFVNDIAVALDGAAYVTDSQSPVIYRVVAERGRRGATTFRLERWLDLAGTAIQYRPGFNLNGIEATLDGRYLVAVQSNTGQLFRVDARTRAVVEIDLAGDRLPNGDGLLLRGTTLYAVQNQQGLIAEVRLDDLRGAAPTGRVIARTGDPSFRYPTTVEAARGRLLVVNSQFDRRAPGAVPALPFTVSVVAR